MISNSFIVLDTFWSLSRLMYIVSVILLNVLIVVHRFIAEITIDHKQVSLSTISCCHEKKKKGFWSTISYCICWLLSFD